MSGCEQVSAKSLQVTVCSCTALPNIDGFLAGKSDPYVIVNIPGKQNSTFKTPIIDNNLNPVWDHTEMIHDFCLGDSLEFQVWDSDTFPKPDQLLGKVTLHPEDFAANPYGMEGDLPLEAGDRQGHQATLSLKVYVHDDQPALAHSSQELAAADAPSAPAPAVTDTTHAAPAAAAVTVPATAQKMKLRVEIIGARINSNSTGSAAVNPYVVCQTPQYNGGIFHAAKKYKTPQLNSNTNPVWKHVIEITNFFVGKDKLEFELWSHENFPHPERSLGKVELSADDFVVNPEGLEGELPMTGARGEESAILSIRVHVMEDVPAIGQTWQPSNAQRACEAEMQHTGAPLDNAAPGTQQQQTQQPMYTSAIEQVPVGQQYHGGILVNEKWSAPVFTTGPRAGTQAPVMPGMRGVQVGPVQAAAAPGFNQTIISSMPGYAMSTTTMTMGATTRAMPMSTCASMPSMISAPPAMLHTYAAMPSMTSVPAMHGYAMPRTQLMSART